MFVQKSQIKNRAYYAENSAIIFEHMAYTY